MNFFVLLQASTAKEEKSENTETINKTTEEKGKPTSLIGILKEKTEKMSEEGKTNETSDLGVDKYPAEDEKVDDASKDGEEERGEKTEEETQKSAAEELQDDDIATEIKALEEEVGKIEEVESSTTGDYDDDKNDEGDEEDEEGEDEDEDERDGAEDDGDEEALKEEFENA